MRLPCSPSGVTSDVSNNIYISDIDNFRIRKVIIFGLISTFAGDGLGGYNGDGIPATSAELDGTVGLVADASGNIYLTDNSRIRKVNTSGIINTLAGNGISGYNGDGIPADSAELNLSVGVAIDASGNIYIADVANQRIRKVTISSNYYNYLWSPSGGTNLIASNLSAGTYTITATDNNGCTATASAIITQPPALFITADSINSTNGNCNGSAWVLVNGGTSPYNYLWTGGLTTDTITNQCANYYCCTITDVNGCIDSSCVNIDVSTGADKLASNNGQLTIYPNPNNGTFILSLSNVNEKCNLEVYNVFSEKILTETLRSAQGDNLINLSSQPNGIYFYRILCDNGALIGEGKIIIGK